jgi:cytochrome c oxidase subunit 2
VTVPAGTTIEFQLKSADTSHGFRIIGQSIDLTIPKRGRGDATVTFTPPEPGTYIFECSRMCGAGHSFMRGVIRVKPTGATGATGLSAIAPRGATADATSIGNRPEAQP